MQKLNSCYGSITNNYLIGCDMTQIKRIIFITIFILLNCHLFNIACT